MGSPRELLVWHCHVASTGRRTYLEDLGIGLPEGYELSSLAKELFWKMNRGMLKDEEHAASNGFFNFSA